MVAELLIGPLPALLLLALAIYIVRRATLRLARAVRRFMPAKVASVPTPTVDGDVDEEDEEEYSQEVVGESHYQTTLERIVGGRAKDGAHFECEATLVNEPKNPHDPNAVRVEINGAAVGYLPRSDAARHRKAHPVGTAPVARKALITGGWVRPSGSQGSFGVRLAS